MHLNEHQGKRLLATTGISVPPGELIAPGAVAGYTSPFPFPVVLKAQVLGGGRGKAGGIRSVPDQSCLPHDLQELFATTIQGQTVPLVRIEPWISCTREFYLSLSVSRSKRTILFTVARQGGVEIESLGGDNLLVQAVDAASGLREHQIRAAFFHLDVASDQWPGFRSLCNNLGRGFVDNGLLLAEINPLVVSGNVWLALDAKVEIDDNALALAPDLAGYVTMDHLTPFEIEARTAGLSYHALDGWIGIVANGAGLSMATMDLLHDQGMPPANFLDLGGGADQARMAAALSILVRDEHVRAVFVNIFGGIVSCQAVAEAMRRVLADRPTSRPMVVRFAGHGSEAGRCLLQDLQNPDLHVYEDLGPALERLAALAPFPGPIQASGDPPDFSRPEDLLRPVNRPGRGPLGILTPDAPVLVQGMTGREGRLHTRLMCDSGTRIVAGVTPFKGGREVDGLPVYHSVHQALHRHDVAASLIFVPAAAAVDAVLEAAQAGIPWVVCITEGIPQQDMLRALPVLASSPTRLVGPNTPGLIIPGVIKLGIMPGSVFRPGPVAILSRSGTLTYECVSRLSQAGIGQSLCLGIGGDPFVGQSFVDICGLLRDDPATEAVLLLGEVGGNAEEELAAYLRSSGFPKPVVAFVAGRTAPPGKRLGHAGAILDACSSIESKLEALRRVGITVCPNLRDIPACVARVLRT